MVRRSRVPLVMAVALLAVLLAAAAFSAVTATSRASERNGRPAGEVLIGDNLVMVLLTSAGIYSPSDRAAIVAERLNDAMSAGLQAEQLSARSLPGGEGVYAGERLIVSVYGPEANAHGSTPAALADSWRDSIGRVLFPGEALPEAEPPAAEQPAETSGPAESAPPSGELDWTGTAQKWVPIFSLETEGAYLGAAQIAGPTAQVNKVKGVAELRLNFQNIGRIYAYVPTATISVTKLDRVQGVSVWATGDIRLAKF